MPSSSIRTLGGAIYITYIYIAYIYIYIYTYIYIAGRLAATHSLLVRPQGAAGMGTPEAGWHESSKATEAGEAAQRV